MVFALKNTISEGFPNPFYPFYPYFFPGAYRRPALKTPSTPSIRPENPFYPFPCLKTNRIFDQIVGKSPMFFLPRRGFLCREAHKISCSCVRPSALRTPSVRPVRTCHKSANSWQESSNSWFFSKFRFESSKSQTCVLGE